MSSTPAPTGGPGRGEHHGNGQHRPAAYATKSRPREWAVRIDLAAAYRLVALYGWDDLIFTHLSARVPGPDHHFLINPYHLMFEEMTASRAGQDRP